MRVKRVHLHVVLAVIFVAGFVWDVTAAEISVDTERAGFLVDKIIGAYGGRDIIEKTGAVYASGEINAILLNDHGTYERYMKRDRKLMVETKYQRSSEHRILNGKKGYRGTHSIPLTEVADHRFLAMLYQYKYLDLPYGLLKNAYEISYKGKDKVDGIEVEVLGLTDSEGPSMEISVDTTNFMVLKVSGYFTIGTNKTDLTAVFSDFRKEGGMTFPYRLVNYGGGVKIGETVIKEYRVNPVIDDKIFEP
jgi:hypothetical protein